MMRVQANNVVWGCVTAGLIAGIINLPLLRAVTTEHELAWEDVVQESSDEYFYLTRIREVADGHPGTGSPYLFERRDQSYPLGNMWERILSLPMTAFGWSIKTVSLFGDTLLPFLCALLAWFAFGQVILDKRWRTLALGIAFLGMQVTLWKRPVSPQAITLLPLVWLWMFLSPSRDATRSKIVRSVLIGLMAYSYPFHWTYCAISEAIVWISSVRSERRLSRRSAMDAFALALPFLIIALPWMLGTLAMMQGPARAETLSRLGLIDRRLPVGPMIQLKLLLCIALVLYATWKKPIPWRTPLLALLLGGMAMLWLPLVTGKEAEFANHYGKILLFPMAITIVCAVKAMTETSRVAAYGVMALLGLTLTSSTLSTTIADIRVFESARPSPERRTAMNDAMQLLKSLPREQVILTENSFAQKLTVYTSHYPFAFYDAYMYLASDKELLDRAEVYNTLVPDEPLSPRGVFGTRYLNRELYAKTLCRLRHPFDSGLCAAVTAECPACAAVLHPPAFTEKDVVSALSDAHVTYVFLKKIPAVLRPYLQLVGAADGRTLYAFSAPR